MRIRLIGTEIEAFWGKGIPVGQDIDTGSSPEWACYDRVFSRCAQQLCAVFIRRSMKNVSGVMMDMHALCVPLSDKQGNPTFMLGVLLANYAINRKDEPIEPAIFKNEILEQDYLDLGSGVPPSTYYTARQRLPHLAV